MDAESVTESRWRKWLAVMSAGLCVVVAMCLVIQPDWLAALILVPAWCWLIPGLAMLCLGMTAIRPVVSCLILVGWVAFIAVFVEEAWSLIRLSDRPAVHREDAPANLDSVRVVTLNCAGDIDSVNEALAFNPNIILLQESPGRQQLQQLLNSKTDPGFLAHGMDTSIIVIGEMASAEIASHSHFMLVTTVSPSGRRVGVVSTRLAPPIVRVDFWTPRFWREHRDKRVVHREQVHEILDAVNRIADTDGVIVGGDFNAPPNDDALAPLGERLLDTFSLAGVGWGCTGTNEYPLFRVDQIWTDRSFEVESAAAFKTVHSDHRMVVCDLIGNQR